MGSWSDLSDVADNTTLPAASSSEEDSNVALMVVLATVFALSLMGVGFCLWRNQSGKFEEETELKAINENAQPGEKYKEQVDENVKKSEQSELPKQDVENDHIPDISMGVHEAS